MREVTSKLYSRDGLTTKGFTLALSLPYCAHFSVTERGIFEAITP